MSGHVSTHFIKGGHIGEGQWKSPVLLLSPAHVGQGNVFTPILYFRLQQNSNLKCV